MLTQTSRVSTETTRRALIEATAEVIRQVGVSGLTTKEVARLLNISFKTAESHRSHIMKKLNVHEVTGLVRYAIQHGLLRA